jgi:hypothetical protein
VEPRFIRVIASAAKQSRVVRGTVDCLTASLRHCARNDGGD